MDEITKKKRRTNGKLWRTQSGADKMGFTRILGDGGRGRNRVLLTQNKVRRAKTDFCDRIHLWCCLVLYLISSGQSFHGSHHASSEKPWVFHTTRRSQKLLRIAQKQQQEGQVKKEKKEKLTRKTRQ